MIFNYIKNRTTNNTYVVNENVNLEEMSKVVLHKETKSKNTEQTTNDKDEFKNIVLSPDYLVTHL